MHACPPRRHVGRAAPALPEIGADNPVGQRKVGGDFGKSPRGCRTGRRDFYPKRTHVRFDYEGEVAIVIGKRGKDIPGDRIDSVRLGRHLFHDWSIRDGGASGPSRPDRFSYNLAKNFDGSTSMGPCIVVERARSPERQCGDPDQR